MKDKDKENKNNKEPLEKKKKNFQAAYTSIDRAKTELSKMTGFDADKIFNDVKAELSKEMDPTLNPFSISDKGPSFSWVGYLDHVLKTNEDETKEIMEEYEQLKLDENGTFGAYSKISQNIAERLDSIGAELDKAVSSKNIEIMLKAMVNWYINEELFETYKRTLEDIAEYKPELMEIMNANKGHEGSLAEMLDMARDLRRNIIKTPILTSRPTKALIPTSNAIRELILTEKGMTKYLKDRLLVEGSKGYSKWSMKSPQSIRTLRKESGGADERPQVTPEILYIYIAICSLYDAGNKEMTLQNIYNAYIGNYEKEEKELKGGGDMEAVLTRAIHTLKENVFTPEYGNHETALPVEEALLYYMVKETRNRKGHVVNALEILHEPIMLKMLKEKNMLRRINHINIADPALNNKSWGTEPVKRVSPQIAFIINYVRYQIGNLINMGGSKKAGSSNYYISLESCLIEGGITTKQDEAENNSTYRGKIMKYGKVLKTILKAHVLYGNIKGFERYYKAGSNKEITYKIELLEGIKAAVIE